MIPALLILFGLMAIYTYLWVRVDPAEREPIALKRIAIAVCLVIIAMALTGRMHWLAAIFGALPLVWRTLVRVLGILPLISGLLGKRRQRQQTRARASRTEMDYIQALEVLGLSEPLDRQMVINAHRNLMQRCHPDQGGSDFLAAQLNQARDILLEKLPRE